jgi:hypothetical protein
MSTFQGFKETARTCSGFQGTAEHMLGFLWAGGTGPSRPAGGTTGPVPNASLLEALKEAPEDPNPRYPGDAVRESVRRHMLEKLRAFLSGSAIRQALITVQCEGRCVGVGLILSWAGMQQRRP